MSPPGTPGCPISLPSRAESPFINLGVDEEAVRVRTYAQGASTTNRDETRSSNHTDPPLIRYTRGAVAQKAGSDRTYAVRAGSPLAPEHRTSPEPRDYQLRPEATTPSANPSGSERRSPHTQETDATRQRSRPTRRNRRSDDTLDDWDRPEHACTDPQSHDSRVEPRYHACVHHPYERIPFSLQKHASQPSAKYLASLGPCWVA